MRVLIRTGHHGVEVRNLRTRLRDDGAARAATAASDEVRQQCKRDECERGEQQPASQAQQIVKPLFVVQGLSHREPVPGLREVFRDSAASLLAQVEADLEAGQWMPPRLGRQSVEGIA